MCNLFTTHGYPIALLQKHRGCVLNTKREVALGGGMKMFSTPWIPFISTFSEGSGSIITILKSKLALLLEGFPKIVKLQQPPRMP